jgi:hypothetical protein
MADPLSVVAASWLGRNVYSGEPTELPSVTGLSSADIAYHTAVPRRFGFHAVMMSPFRLHPEMTESQLLKALMHFAGAQTPFEIDRLEVARIGRCFGLMPQVPSTAMHLLAANVVQEFDAFRAPLSEDEIERSDPDRLTAPQFSNLHRWGDPHVMDEYRFHMMLTGPLASDAMRQVEPPLRELLEPCLATPLSVGSLALFVEQETGAPLRVHSQHPLGKISTNARAERAKRMVADPSLGSGSMRPLPLIVAALMAQR